MQGKNVVTNPGELLTGKMPIRKTCSARMGFVVIFNFNI